MSRCMTVGVPYQHWEDRPRFGGEKQDVSLDLFSLGCTDAPPWQHEVDSKEPKGDCPCALTNTSARGEEKSYFGHLETTEYNW